MSYIIKGMNFIAKPSYASGEVWGGASNLSIIYYLPTNVTVHHFRVTLHNVNIYSDWLRVNKIKGKFRQYDSANNLLSETSIEVVKGTSVTISASTGVDHVELFITYYETVSVALASRNLGVDVVVSGTGNEVIRIATEDGSNVETSSVRFTSYKVITLAKVPETVHVIGEQPTRVFSITTTNTNNYIKGWLLDITGVSGSANPDEDKVYLQLLDAYDNILASINVGVAIGNVGVVDHDTSTKKIRVYLSTTKRLIVACRVNELVNPTYGVP